MNSFVGLSDEGDISGGKLEYFPVLTNLVDFVHGSDHFFDILRLITD